MEYVFWNKLQPLLFSLKCFRVHLFGFSVNVCERVNLPHSTQRHGQPSRLKSVNEIQMVRIGKVAAASDGNPLQGQAWAIYN